MNEYVEGKLGTPGIALAVVGLLGILTNLLNLVWQTYAAVMTILALVQSNADAAGWFAWIMNSGWMLFWGLVTMASSVVVLMAGLRMRSARSAGLVYTGSIFAMLPCCVNACCCAGLPVGIWAIVTLQDEQVKAAFSEG